MLAARAGLRTIVLYCEKPRPNDAIAPAGGCSKTVPGRPATGNRQRARGLTAPACAGEGDRGGRKEAGGEEAAGGDRGVEGGSGGGRRRGRTRRHRRTRGGGRGRGRGRGRGDRGRVCLESGERGAEGGFGID